MIDMRHFMLLLMVLVGMSEAKVPWRPSVVGVKWAGNEALLSTEKEVDERPRLVQLFYTAKTVSPGKTEVTTRRMARSVPMTAERDIRSLGYRFVEASFAIGDYSCEASLAEEPAAVRMTAPAEKQNEPVHIRWSGGSVKLYSRVEDGMVCFCSEWKDFRGRRKSAKKRLYRGSSLISIESIRGQFDEHGVYISAKTSSPFRCVVSKNGIIVCEPEIKPSEVQYPE